MTRFIFILLAIIVLGAGGYWLSGAGTSNHAMMDQMHSSAPLAEVQLPGDLSAEAQIGKQAFNANCAVCHGDNAAGRDGVAPPLVHMIYEPSHHGDESFQLAVAQGVRAHHWPFGDMPPVDGLTRDDVALIVSYVRELQRANGIN